jgi:hypothetical protein
MRTSKTIRARNLVVLSLCLLVTMHGGLQNALAQGSHDDLLRLFADWREFERPPLLDGAPDYTAETFALRYERFLLLRNRLQRLDPGKWPIPQQVDWHIVRAEMNGFDFNHRVLQPWVRDPAFYRSIWTSRSDVPAHEGPTHHAVVELWTYEFPLSDAEEQRLISELGTIPPLMRQARKNLTGNARDLWVAGIRNIRRQAANLQKLQQTFSDSGSDALLAVIQESLTATNELIAWLQQQAPSKSGPSGVGKENYTWYQQNVHLVPLTWEQEVDLLKRELDRAWSSLKLEEQRNRDLPPMVAATTPAEYDAKADQAASRIMRFLAEKEILTVEDYMEPAMREHLGAFVPEETRIRARCGRVPCFTTSTTAGTKARPPVSKKCSCMRVFMTTIRARVNWSGSCSRNAPHGAWAPCMHTPTR